MEILSANQRYRFIELIAWWEGRINTTQLTQAFSISRQQASNDINRYREQAADNLTYDASEKAWKPTENFTFCYINQDVVEYLDWIHNANPSQKTYNLPSVALTLPPRQVSPLVMRGLITAIRRQQRVEVDYVSLSNPNSEGRIIAPHHFVNTGLRWHLRAWCEKSQDYRDFVLSRFHGHAELLGKATHTVESDIGWNTQVTVILRPDPRLSPAQCAVLEKDYQMQNSQLCITTQACLVNYLLQELQISTKILDGTPEAQQLVLVNRDDIKEWLFEH